MQCYYKKIKVHLIIMLLYYLGLLIFIELSEHFIYKVWLKKTNVSKLKNTTMHLLIWVKLGYYETFLLKLFENK